MANEIIVKAAVRRWLPVILSVLAGVKGSITEDTAIMLACICQAEDTARYARAHSRDLDNVEIWENLQLIAVAEKLMYMSLVNSGDKLLRAYNPDVYQSFARRHHR